MEDFASVHVVVSGRVQGVFFRAFVSEKAEQLRLTGCVRNLHSGEVEVVVEGNKAQLEEMVRFLKTGPPSARVGKVTTHWSECRGLYKSFSIRY